MHNQHNRHTHPHTHGEHNNSEREGDREHLNFGYGPTMHVTYRTYVHASQPNYSASDIGGIYMSITNTRGKTPQDTLKMHAEHRAQRESTQTNTRKYRRCADAENVPHIVRGTHARTVTKTTSRRINRNTRTQQPNTTTTQTIQLQHPPGEIRAPKSASMRLIFTH